MDDLKKICIKLGTFFQNFQPPSQIWTLIKSLTVKFSDAFKQFCTTIDSLNPPPHPFCGQVRSFCGFFRASRISTY